MYSVNTVVIAFRFTDEDYSNDTTQFTENADEWSQRRTNEWLAHFLDEDKTSKY